MPYLILHSFRSYGVSYKKGDVVNENAIRSPRLRLAEGKILAVSDDSNTSQEAAELTVPSSQISTETDEVTTSDILTKTEESSVEDSVSPVDTKEVITEPATKTPGKRTLKLRG